MTKFLQYINENKLIITIKDIKNIAYKENFNNNISRTANFLLDYWYENDKKEVFYFLKMFSDVSNKALSILKNKTPDKKLPYFDKNSLIKQYLDMEELPEKIDQLWPVVIYISANDKDKNTIGLLIHKNRKIEEFEGNDLVTNETQDLVDYVLGISKTPVKVYCNQEIELVRKIEKTKILPKGLYVSPDKKYAEGYWSMKQQRVLFSCEALKINFFRESELDWRVKDNTKIKNFKYE